MRLAGNMRELAQGKTSSQVKFELTNNLVQGRVNQHQLEEVKSGPVVKWSCRHSQTSTPFRNGNLLPSAPRADAKHAQSHMTITPPSRTLLHPLTILP
jgi:hypothetical protein